MPRAWPAVQVVPRGGLAYGMQLPIVAQSPIFAQPWEAGADAGDVVRIAQACDRAGFFYLAVSDHVCIPRDRATAMSTVWYDPVSTLGALRRAAERGDGWLPQGVPQMGLAEAIAYIRRIRGDEPIEIGANSPRLYVGTPRFDLGPNARSGRGEAIAALLRDLQALGVSHVGVRFRTRSVDELLEQIDAFAREVAPHL